MTALIALIAPIWHLLHSCVCSECTDSDIRSLTRTRREDGKPVQSLLSVLRWPGIAGIVDAPEVEFMFAALAWERTGSPQDSDRVAQAYDSVLKAWRRAVDAFQEHQVAGERS